MTWYHNGKPFTSEMIDDNLGFVYIITNTKNNKLYIGKKGLMSKRRLPPLKGAKRKRIKIVETDWKTYCGSSEEVKLLVEENGISLFHREIIRLCKTKGELNYYEAKLQFETDCLLKPDEYYNAFIGCKINRSHLLTKVKK
jgi:hypothetical protein|tara:strand:+ start:374 stop:796 length:423 start_codon:yes stop_codon:yes gene_type:complete